MALIRRLEELVDCRMSGAPKPISRATSGLVFSHLRDGTTESTIWATGSKPRCDEWLPAHVGMDQVRNQAICVTDVPRASKLNLYGTIPCTFKASAMDLCTIDEANTLRNPPPPAPDIFPPYAPCCIAIS